MIRSDSDFSFELMEFASVCTRLSFRQLGRSLVVALLVALLAGCQRDEIRTYAIPKETEPVAADTASGKDRLLGAILPHGSQAWFFKLTGPKQIAEKKKDEFLAVVTSVRFDQDSGSNPQWTLPDGWTQQAGGEFRFATLSIPVDEGAPLECSVSTLPMEGWQRSNFELENINRWRRQLGLPLIGISHLITMSEQLDCVSGKATIVDYVGDLQAADMTPPFASSPSGSGPAGGGGPAKLTYDTPAGWEAAPWTVSRKGITITYAAAFRVTADSDTVEITVSEFGPAAGSGDAVLANVNRWRGQLNLPRTTMAALKSEFQDIEVAGAEAKYVQMVGRNETGTDQTILAVIAQNQQSTWFFKLIGDKELAERETANFEAFVKSVKFQ
jgi:hypothetical protein